MALWVYYRHAESCCVLCSHAFSVLFSIAIYMYHLGRGKEKAGLCASRAFIYITFISFCLFSSPEPKAHKVRL